MRRLYGESGQDLVEYVLVGAFIALIAYGGASTLGKSLYDWSAATAEKIAKEREKSNCSSQGMIASEGKCHGN
jgi:Flp pilus assembly pilin Flp